MTDPIINLSAFNETKAIMKDKMALLIDCFLEDAHSYLATIDEGLAEHNTQKIAATAHTIKSSSRQVGADTLSAIAESIEYQGQALLENNDSNTDSLKPLCAELHTAVKDVESELKKLK